ncbi:xanthine phosphoribosyltransferase [Clostridium argentinense CDC 2741]|uniref:Xanthine phosphoribosyltransferase n=1 Tax=Clostridium argentinense CDC 2741 TaxID=1418104 RepID=A0A0C1R1V7_9CLOT|nr:xanthine phosphoribosyltransferase [Clostridium argentinense]ARC84078.1 xanthine phosphoribosyltransferase [Clostridium argentinense]KIE44426.1 xanthine phosphoribosyltransferase [Clostridium argentinense CDC 2741]NFF39317.1 xanthine phosphoribosyltransferase [Clostridium argentinense]NFP51440.1 xanthine phosphoribosyltransferase [Clostridium argentinense]NFP74652.1 xanthine phosphoribosyltransferase [Clostridium argentinense]
MKLLKDKILSAGNLIGKDVIKVDNFLNHQIDIELFNEMGKEFQKRFKNKEINKILTVEASGIGIACIVAQYFNNCPVVFAKKHEAVNMDMDTYESEVYSFTKKKSYKVRVSKKFINEGDKILIIDDFLANGQAVLGLANIVKQGSGEIAGVGIAIEKSFQEGRKKIEDIGIQVESLARIKGFENNTIIFHE